MPYYVISGNEDGDIYITEETKDSLLKQLKPNKYGDADIDAKHVSDSIFGANLAYWPGSFALIIEGEIVTPAQVGEGG